MNLEKDDSKELAKLFNDMYEGCLKFKLSKKHKKDSINCDEYYNKFKFYSDKSIDSNNIKNDINSDV